MKKLCTALAVLCLLCGGFLTTPALAAQADQAGKPQPDKPAKADARVTAVTVIAEGTDSIGAKLVTGLKEAFNQSNLFALNEKDEPKLQLLVTTQPEFPSRPNVGSVYSVCWVFKQGEGYLNARTALPSSTATSGNNSRHNDGKRGSLQEGAPFFSAFFVGTALQLTPYGLSFRGKTRFFPLAVGRATLCRAVRSKRLRRFPLPEDSVSRLSLRVLRILCILDVLSVIFLNVVYGIILVYCRKDHAPDPAQLPRHAAFGEHFFQRTF